MLTWGGGVSEPRSGCMHTKQRPTLGRRKNVAAGIFADIPPESKAAPYSPTLHSITTGQIARQPPGTFG